MVSRRSLLASIAAGFMTDLLPALNTGNARLSCVISGSEELPSDMLSKAEMLIA